MHILDIIQQVVTACQQTGVITSIVYADPYWNASFDNIGTVQINDYITINGSDCLIVDIQDEMIVIKSDANLTGATSFAAKKPYFYFEKWIPTANYLSLKDMVRKLSLQKYPLIFVPLDLSETREELKPYNTVNNLNIYFIQKTDPKQDANWRLNNVYKAELIPLYELFMSKLKANYYIANQFNNLIGHSYSELFYLGTADKNQNKLNDYVDAIQINISELKIKNLKNC